MSRPRGSAVNGVLLLDKAGGITSQAAVSRVRILLSARKAGHTGTLDPLADGLLPVCFGEATKFSQLLLDADKEYRAVVRLGLRTTTGDLEGAVVARSACEVDVELIRDVLPRFEGEITQVPPMYSALKRDGRPLYAYARAGEELPREPRRVRIRQLEMQRYDGSDLTISVTCSKGTYIRVLAEDIGRALGCGACLAALTRTAVGGFRLAGALKVEELESMPLEERRRRLLPVDALVSTLPRIDLDAAAVALVKCGQPFDRPAGAGLGLSRLYGPGAEFLGVADAQATGMVVARRLMAFSSASATKA